jgi:hypothetical protein
MGRRDAAIEDFRQALRVDPCLASARNNLARISSVGPAPAFCP